jgi:hypothetical protein
MSSFQLKTHKAYKKKKKKTQENNKLIKNLPEKDDVSLLDKDLITTVFKKLKDMNKENNTRTKW